MIFVTMRFYVKSILCILEMQQLPFLPFLGDVNILHLENFGLQKMQNFIKIQIHSRKCGKMADFAHQESLNLISRKIWMIQNQEISTMCIVTQILREIKISEFRVCKSAIHASREALNLYFCNFSTFWKLNSEPLKILAKTAVLELLQRFSKIYFT